MAKCELKSDDYKEVKALDAMIVIAKFAIRHGAVNSYKAEQISKRGVWDNSHIRKFDMGPNNRYKYGYHNG